ncbi:hypothetical protein F5Y14DRAFT_446779 [Nemania sp. NC0429]|nr:hypothetical protein F5Y14DRAFT_446779 [Nemania sp. NC0429]
MWAREQREHSTIKETAGDFEGYVAAARRRLRDHGFTEEFRLDEDPRRQDERLTWIEYLEFEYWWLDKRARSVETAQERHERVWEKIVESGIPRPGETREELLASHARPTADGNSPLTRHSARQEASQGKLIDRLKRTAQVCKAAKAAETRQLRLVEWALAQMPRKPKPPSAGPAKTGNKRRRQEDDDDAADDDEADAGGYAGKRWRLTAKGGPAD